MVRFQMKNEERDLRKFHIERIISEAIDVIEKEHGIYGLECVNDIIENRMVAAIYSEQSKILPNY